MGDSSTHRTPIHPMADHTKIPEQHLAPPQSDRCSSTTTISHQGLGDTSSAPRGPTIPLPDNPGTHRPRPTSSQVYPRRRLHLAKVGRRAPTTVCPLAIPTTIPHTTPRWPMATHHALTTRKAHGVPRSLHATHRHPHHRPIQEHDAWKHLAPTNSDMDALSPFDLRPEHSHPTRSPIHQHPEDDRPVESLFSTVGTTPTSPSPPLHATNGLDPTPTWAKQHHQHSQQPAPLDPTLHWAIQQQAKIPNINEVRHNIADELQQLVSDWSDTTHDWYQQLPYHCQRAYQQPTMITQIPLLHHLLQTIQYPHADILFRELTDGFPLIGHLQPGLNWKVRTDTKYTEHQSLPELHSYNRDYILKKLHQHRVDDHWQMMADEIAKEVQMGRMDGPFTAPTWWDVPAVALRTHEHTKHLKPLPHPTPVIAVAFSIHQTGSDGRPKVRQRRRLEKEWSQPLLQHGRPTSSPHTRSLRLVSPAHQSMPTNIATCLGT